MAHHLRHARKRHRVDDLETPRREVIARDGAHLPVAAQQARAFDPRQSFELCEVARIGVDEHAVIRQLCADERDAHRVRIRMLRDQFLARICPIRDVVFAKEPTKISHAFGNRIAFVIDPIREERREPAIRRRVARRAHVRRNAARRTYSREQVEKLILGEVLHFIETEQSDLGAVESAHGLVAGDVRELNHAAPRPPELERRPIERGTAREPQARARC